MTCCRPCLAAAKARVQWVESEPRGHSIEPWILALNASSNSNSNWNANSNSISHTNSNAKLSRSFWFRVLHATNESAPLNPIKNQEYKQRKTNSWTQAAEPLPRGERQSR